MANVKIIGPFPLHGRGVNDMICAICQSFLTHHYHPALKQSQLLPQANSVSVYLFIKIAMAVSKKQSTHRLASYPRRNESDALLTGKPSDDKIILQARKITRSDTRCFLYRHCRQPPNQRAQLQPATQKIRVITHKTVLPVGRWHYRHFTSNITNSNWSLLSNPGF